MKVVQCYWWNWNPTLVNESDKLFCVLCSLCCAFSDFWFERLEFFFAIIFYAVWDWCWKLLNVIVFCLFVVRTKNFVKISNFSRIFEFLRQVRVPEQVKNRFENFHGFIADERSDIEHQKFDIFQNQTFVHHCSNVLWWVSKFSAWKFVWNFYKKSLKRALT